MLKNEPITWKEVTDEEWAAFCAKFPCYGTQPLKETMVHRMDTAKFTDKGKRFPYTSTHVGKVSYRTNPATYYINTELKEVTV